MNGFQRFAARILGVESKYTSLDLFREVYGGRESSSGITINPMRALEVQTVLACVRVIAEGVSQVPWKVYQDTGAGKAIAFKHPVHDLIYRRPNRVQTSFAFRETALFHLLLTGNAYAWKGMVGANRELRELVLLDPARMTVDYKDGTLSYRFRGDDGLYVDFSEDAIWHLRGPSWNGWAGLDAIKLARDAIGLSIATEKAHAELHKNGVKSSGLLSVEGALTPERYEKLYAWLDKFSLGEAFSSKPILLDGGAKYVPFSMTGVDAQHLETRKHQIEEICRGYRVMPIMVGHADKTATYASAEQMFLAHVVHTLMPWFERIEQSADASLFSDQDRAAGYYTKFNPNALMRGAAKDRAEFYQKALGAGGHGTAWMTPNEVRALEEMDPIAGGDQLARPEAITGNDDGQD